MPNDLSHISPVRRSGDERMHSSGRLLGFTLLDFWSWSSSDLTSNATRGVLAEFIVASALGVAIKTPREEWRAFDLVTPEEITVEVKSAAYIQSRKERSLSSVVFRIPKTRAWAADTGVLERESRRQAQVYVFALLAHKEMASIDPLNVNQWSFFVLPTAVLDARTRINNTSQS